MPLRSHGSLSMNRALMAAGLVDHVRVTLFPVITGQTGLDPIFQGAADFDLSWSSTGRSTVTSKSSSTDLPSIDPRRLWATSTGESTAHMGWFGNTLAGRKGT